MGGGGSTRRIVIEEDEATGMVKVSDAVARRLLGHHEAGPRPVSQDSIYQGSRVATKDQMAEMEKLENFYKDRIRALELQNAELHQTTTEQFAKAVEEVEEKFLKTTSSPICSDLQDEVLKCYQNNPNQGLNCSAQVRQFSECVRQQREKMLTFKG